MQCDREARTHASGVEPPKSWMCADVGTADSWGGTILYAVACPVH
jgi:hypothetical protein